MSRLLSLVLLSLLLAVPATAQSAEPLALGSQGIEKEIGGGGSHSFDLAVEAGHRAHVIVEQRGVDVVVTAYGPDDSQVHQIDSPNGTQGPEELIFTALESGNHRIAVHTLDENAETGLYEIRLAGMSTPEEIAAEEALVRERHEAAIAWLSDNAIPLRGAAAGQGFADMEPLRAVVGDARVVSLGEATHGTREFFQLKHRMLEFLVEEMDFNLFGIEATMPEAFDINEYVLHGRGNPAEALSGLYFWTWDTEEVLEMIEWMRRYNADPQNTRKVKFYGFDMQSAPRAARVTLDYLKEVEPDKAKEARAVLGAMADPFLAQQTSDALSSKEERHKAAVALLQHFDEKREAYVEKTSGERWAIARQHAQVLAQSAELALDFRTGYVVRDRAMAENTLWILDHEGPDSKIVLWAHNGHVNTGPLFGDVDAMGKHLDDALGDDMVVFGFSFNQGSFQAYSMDRKLTEFTVDPGPEGSLDATMAAAGLKVAAVDLRALPKSGPAAEWFAEPRGTRSIGALYNPQFAANVFAQQITPDLYDALLFVEETTRARPNPGGQRASTENLAEPLNGDFAAGLDHWSIREAFGYSATAEDVDGRSYAVVRRPAGYAYGETAGLFRQRLDATAYRGKKIRLRASAAIGEDSVAYVFINVARPGFGPAGQGFSGHQVVSGTEWQELEIEGGVHEDATTIAYGIALAGDGEAWLDDVQVEVVAEDGD